MTIPFEPFKKIEHFRRLHVRVTQKMHGTNAVIYIDRSTDTPIVMAGCRTRWITPENDNYGFAKYVEDNRDTFGMFNPGFHYGEWCGPGINSTEGLSAKKLFLFSPPKRYEGRTLPEGTEFIPELYAGDHSQFDIDEIVRGLKENGSKAVPGFMRVEGIVIEVNGSHHKLVFESEETQWDKAPPKAPREQFDYSGLMQPERLKKLITKDERYIREYPKTLVDIVKEYMKDLEDDNQITGTDEERAFKRKDSSRAIFQFVRAIMQEVHNE